VLLAFQLIGYFATSVSQSSATRSSIPSSSTNCRRAFGPFSGPGVHVFLGHLSLHSEPHADNQRNSSNAQGKVPPLVVGRCRSSCSKGVQPLYVARRPERVSDQPKYIKNPNVVDSLCFVHLLCVSALTIKTMLCACIRSRTWGYSMHLIIFELPGTLSSPTT
jgi:hypothetical protein